VAKILVVDDNPQVRELLRDFLEARGYEITLAEDGERALAAIDRAPPDLLLLDLMMPGVTGMAILRQLRQVRPELPVLVLTAVNELEVARAALDLGAYDYLTKPVDLGILERVVKDAVLSGEARR
jgi:DNA-binding response OmpR family regulator